MSSWRQTTLGEFITVKHGFAYKGEYFSDHGKYVVLTPGNFHEEGGFKLRPGKDRYYQGEIPQGYIHNKGDLIVAMTEQAEGLLGSAAIIPASDSYLHNQRLGLVRVKLLKANTRYVYYVFNTSSVRQQIRGSSSGTKIRHTSPGRICNVNVFAPEVEVQKKIAAILSAYDDLIENNQRRIALLEKMAEELYREWFVRLRFPGHEQAKFEKGVPEGWSLVEVEKAFDYTGGGTPPKEVTRYWQDGSINWYTPSDITASRGIFMGVSGDRCSEEGFNNSSAKMFPAYSVMMTSRATIGAIGINLIPACTNQGFITCIPNERYPLSFLYHWLKLSKRNFEILSGGATFLELTKGTFKKIEILTPPKGIVQNFDKLAAPMFNMIKKLTVANRNIQKSRDVLLPRLISGKLSVESLAIHFPPSMQETTDEHRHS